MANSQVTVRDTQLEKQRLGFINLNLTELTTTTEPDIASGSIVEVGGSLYSFTAAESPSGWSGIANSTQAYIKLTPGASSVTSSFTTTAPTYSDAKGGWYSGDDRYVARVYKNASGEAVQKETYAQESESADALQLLLDSLPAFTSRTVYSTTGSDTWVCPEDIRVAQVYILSGGGGGGGAFCSSNGSDLLSAGAGGGSAGAQSVARFAVVPGKEYSLTVGAGGAGASSGSNNGSAGGDSIFDSTTISGGAAGSGVNHYSGGGTPTPSGGTVADPSVQDSVGSSGGDGETKVNDGSSCSGVGGSPQIRRWPLKIGELGTGGASVCEGVAGNSEVGNSGTTYGAGGSGGAAAHQSNVSGTSAAGGDGADGIVIIAY